MKALSLTQPWATLVALGLKRIETRSWKTSYTGELAIHATREIDNEACMFNKRIKAALERAGVGVYLPTSAIVCLTHLHGCQPTGGLVLGRRLLGQSPEDQDHGSHPEPDWVLGRRLLGQSPVRWQRGDDGAMAPCLEWNITADELAFGNYEGGRVGLLLTAAQALTAPVACRGMQGLWTVPADVEAQVRAQLP